MARLVTKFKYLKSDGDKSIGGYAKYIAVREGVEKVYDTFNSQPSTKRQRKLIEKILRDFPDSQSSFEYADYVKTLSRGNATEFILRTIEANAHTAAGKKTYADYIATRPGAERFGIHGLFTSKGTPVRLSEVSRELNEYKGNVWTVIISLRREDAERLGFNKAERWRDLLGAQMQEMSDCFKIPMPDLKWYAAFHNESHHPHVHLIVYSRNEREDFLTKQGVNKFRSSLAKEIFAQDLLSVYKKQTEYRDSLKRNSRELISRIIAKINADEYINPLLEQKLAELAERLSKTKGRKQYGYLKADVKALADSVVDEISKHESIKTLYELWYEQREEVIHAYTDELPKRVPLSRNNEFKSVRNAVVREAMRIVLEYENAEKQADPNERTEKEMSESGRISGAGYNIKARQNLSAAGITRLLTQIGRIICDRTEKGNGGKTGVVDRKLKRKIDEKKQAQGLQQG